MDRILATTCWDSHFAACFAWSKARVGSDHSPLILDTGETKENRAKYFYFQESWFQYEGFHELVKERWLQVQSKSCSNVYSLDKWHGCLQALRQFLRGWNLNRIGDIKRLKSNLSRRVEEIDNIAEVRLLSMDEWEERISLENNLEDISRKENLQWKQKAGRNWILQGDANTQFFHQFVSGRRRKRCIAMLESESGEIRGQRDISNHIVEYYKQLFGQSDPCSMTLGDNFWPENLKLCEEDKLNLVLPFTLEEIKTSIMDMRDNSAPGPNGFSVSFFQNFWDMVKGDLNNMFRDFWHGQLDIKRINYGVITLVPKLKEANTIKQYRPICLLNVDYKCFTKVLTNRLVPIAKRVVSKNQTGFIKGRNILEGVVVLHEVLHELHKSKSRGLVLKIDFEKAYDRVRWDFLE